MVTYFVDKKPQLQQQQHHQEHHHQQASRNQWPKTSDAAGGEQVQTGPSRQLALAEELSLSGQQQVATTAPGKDCATGQGTQQASAAVVSGGDYKHGDDEAEEAADETVRRQ